MKKRTVLVILLGLLLAGCQPSEQPLPAESTPAVTQPLPSEETAAPTDAPVEEPTTEAYKQQNMVAVSMPPVAEDILSDSGDVLFSYKHQSMQLTTQDPEVANRIILDYLTRVDSVAQELSPQNEDDTAHTVYYSPARVDEAVLSLHGVRMTPGEEGRAFPVCYAANYDMLTGDVLTLGSILKDVQAKDALASLVIEQAQLVAEDYSLFGDYAVSISDRFAREESFDEDWYFSDTGLCFYFSPYEIAPYGSGIITMTIPYETLVGVLDDEFFPPENETLIGSINALLFSQADLDAFTQIAEVILEPEGEQFLLFSNGAVENVFIEYGSWDESGTQFLPACTVFATAVLTPGDAVILQTYIPDTLPNLRITYTSEGTANEIYLSQSGMDSSALLLSME